MNHEVGYLHEPAEVRFVDGIFPLCRVAQTLGYRLIIVTNQSGIARGFYTTAQFDSLMEWMRVEFLREGITLDAVYHCPYHPEHGIGEWKREHEDRKPAPGMLLRGARDLSLDVTRSVMIGDRCSDIAAANAAGLRQAFLINGTETTLCPGNYLPIRHLSEAQSWLEANW